MLSPRARSSRRVPLAAALAALLGWPAVGSAEQDLGDVIVSGEVQAGGRVVEGDTASAQFDKYREIPSGLFGAGRLLVEDKERRYYLRAWADDIAEKDQQYLLELGRYNLWGFTGSYSELLQFYSQQSLSMRHTFQSGSCQGALGQGGESRGYVPPDSGEVKAAPPGGAEVGACRGPPPRSPRRPGPRGGRR